MKAIEAEILQSALTDPKIELKHLDVDAYMKTIKLVKRMSTFLAERASDIRSLINEYNKSFNELVKSEKYKLVLAKDKDSLTTEEQELLNKKAPIQIDEKGFVVGPEDFIDKISAIQNRELKLKKEELNFVKDAKIFKAVVENVSTGAQSALYEFLFKQ